MSERRRDRGIVVGAIVLVALALLLRWCSHRSGPAAPTPSPTNEDALLDYLTEKARALDYDEQRIAAFVRDEVRSEDYPGVFRGPVATLWSGAGNDLDRALLLQALLERSRKKTRLVRGRTIGVEVVAAGGARRVGPSAEADPGARELEKLPDELWHELEVRVRTVSPDSQVSEESIVLRTADLAGVPVRITYHEEGTKAFAVVAAGDRTLVTRSDASTAKRQDVIFLSRGPGVAPSRRRRELFTRELPDFPCAFDPSNDYSCIVTTGWVPDSVRVHETALAKRFREPSLSIDHSIAFAFLARSDASTQKLLQGRPVTARVAQPRITIASTTWETSQDGRRRGASLDLRKNDLAVSGPLEARIAFATARSLVDGSLESSVLEAITGAPALSANDLLANAFARGNAMLAERQALLRRTLGRLLDEASPGASLVVSPEGREMFSVRFDRQPSGLELHASQAVRDGIAATSTWLATNPVVGRDGIDRASLETEVALAVSAKLPMTYPLRIDYSEAPPVWYLGSHMLTYTVDGRLHDDCLYDRVSPSVHATRRFYIDWKTDTFYPQPEDTSSTTSEADLEHARTYTTWWHFGDDSVPGRTQGPISRDAYRDLVTRGATTLRFMDLDGSTSTSEPITLFLIARGRSTISRDGRPYSVPTLSLYGDFEKNHPEKYHDGDPTVARWDAENRASINCLTVLDDPEFPLILANSYSDDFTNLHVQSTIAGRVIDAATGAGVAEARVQIAELGLSAVTWPDGRFRFGSNPSAFAPRQVTVEARDYKRLDATRDFRRADSLPLEVKLEALPRREGVVWIDSSNVATALPPLALTARTKRLITEVVTEEGRAALVPSLAVSGPLGPVDVWLELDPSTFEVYGRLDDGLYGSTLDFLNPGPTALPRAAVTYLSGRIAAWYLFSAGALDAVTLQINHPEMGLAELFKHASKTARELAKMYDGFVIDFAIGAGSGPPVVGGKVMDAAFRQGVSDGLAWCEELYRKEWGVK